MIDINRDSDFRIIFTHKKLLNFQNRRIFYFRNRLYRRYLSLICLLFSEIVTVMINWQQDFVSSNCVCNHTRDSQIRLQLRGLPILLITRMITERIGLHSVLLPLFIISIIIVIIIIITFLTTTVIVIITCTIIIIVIIITLLLSIIVILTTINTINIILLSTLFFFCLQINFVSTDLLMFVFSLSPGSFT